MTHLTKALSAPGVTDFAYFDGILYLTTLPGEVLRWNGHTGDIVVHYDSAHSRTVIDLYVNNDAKPDAEIWLSGDQTLSAADFLL